MPRILDYATPEEFSDALRASGFLSATTAGVLTDAEGLLRRAFYSDNGQLDFVERTHTLSALYDANRCLRVDASQVLAAQESLRNASYKGGGSV